MRKKITLVFLMAAVVCLTLSAAQADYLFDTGTPPSGSGSLPFGSSTGYAGYLTVPAGGWHITGLEAYLVNNGIGSSLSGIVRIWPYSGPLPVNAQALLSLGFAIPAANLSPGWFGRTDLNVDLNPGTYWFGLMNAGGDGGVLYPAPQSFVGEASYYSGGWTAGEPDFGYRITGTGTPVPIPGAAWLLGSGLLGLLGYRRMKKG
jgi:hypothetical protein